MPTSGLSDQQSGGTDLIAPTIQGPQGYSDPGTLAVQLTGQTNNYWQLSIQNQNSGTSASGDLVIAADNGTSSLHYVDLGMNSSGGGSTPFTTANAAYIYSVDNEFDIGALGTTGVTNLYAGGGIATPTQKLTATALGGVTAIGQTGLLGYLKSANMNITTDNTIPLTLCGAAKYAITSILVTNASTSLTTAAGGVYSAASKGGTAIVASGQAYSALTAATSLLSLTIAAAGTASTFTGANLYLNLTSAQGGAATADVYVFGIPLF
jgi:hypothetical protein